VLLWLAGAASAACSRSRAGSAPAEASAHGSSSASAAARARATDRLLEIALAEDARDASRVSDEDLASADPKVRRAAVRALARVADPGALEKLSTALADEDSDVLAWAAHGLGSTCEQDRERVARRLAMRAATLALEPAPRPGRLDPWFALGRALGECATPEAERTLVAWLDGPPARMTAAALGLGDIATRRQRIEEETAAALLRAAGGDAAHDPLAEALYPFGRLKAAPPRAEEQLAALARARLAHESPGRVFAVRALAKVGAGAIDELARVAAAASGFAPEQRAEAARGLGRLGTRGASLALVGVAGSLSPADDPVSASGLVGPGFGPLVTALEGLGPPLGPRARARLAEIASLSVPPQAPEPVRRRVVTLRCAAARASAGEDFEDARLAGCDPDEHGVAGALARIAVLERGRIAAGSRLAAWQGYLTDAWPPRVREAALRSIVSRPEIPTAVEAITAALGSGEPGLVATAAELVAEHPDRAFGAPAKPRGRRRHGAAGEAAAAAAPSPALVEALGRALERQWAADAIETVAEVAKAAGALRLESARPHLQKLCGSHNPTLRAAAQTALASLDGKKAACAADRSRPAAPAAEIARAITGPVKLRLHTDAGDLSIALDPSLAPVAATRVAELARKGFFAGISFHRVVPGFVVQFGDPRADGYGGAGLPPLRCETAPVPFGARVVGVALAGRDTGSSQIFVTLAPSPHLDGHYAVIGRADGPWEAVAEGDVIRKLEVE
jgi:cyclophilin family peptidyl-prolyl cis-trans isomerase/HEAT repeat protein